MMDEELDIEYFSADEGDEDRESSVGFSPDSRRRTLEPRETIINMIGSEMQTGRSGKYAVFVCEVVTGIKTWKQRRRFREFVKLDREIVKLIAESNDPTLKDVWLPIMPPKSITKSSDDPDLVRLRCLKLEEYLRNLVELNFIWDLQGGPLAEFLDDESGTLSVLVELSRLRVWRNALAEDENPSLDSEALQSLRSSLSQVDVELFQRLGNNNSPSIRSSAHSETSSRGGGGGGGLSRSPHKLSSPFRAPPPPPSTPPPKHRHSVDDQGITSGCMPRPSPHSKISQQQQQGSKTMTTEDVVNQQIKIQNQLEQQNASSSVRQPQPSLIHEPIPPPPDVLGSIIGRSGSKNKNISSDTKDSDWSYDSGFSNPNPNLPQMKVVSKSDLRNTISVIRPIPETLQEARELIRKTQRSLSGTMLLHTRELSVSARPTPRKKGLLLPGSKLSKISDVSPLSSTDVSTSQKSIASSIKSYQNSLVLQQQIQVADEDRFEERTGSQLAKEFEEFSLEKYSEFHRPSDISSLDQNDILNDEIISHEQEIEVGGTETVDIKPYDEKDPVVAESEQNIHHHHQMQPTSKKVYATLSATFPLMQQPPPVSSFPVEQSKTQPSTPEKSAGLPEEEEEGEARLSGGFQRLARMPAVKRQSSEEVLQEPPSPSLSSSPTSPRLYKSRNNTGDSIDSPRINIPKSSSSRHRQSSPSMNSFRHNQTSHSFGGGSGSLGSTQSFSSSYSSTIAPPLPPSPPSLPSHEDISTILTLFSTNDITSLLFPQILQVYPLSSFQTFFKENVKAERKEEEEELLDPEDFDNINNIHHHHPHHYPSNNEVLSIWRSGLFDSIDELIGWIQPTVASIIKRKAVFEWVELLVHQALGAKLLSVGSFPQRTFLPESDLDVSAMLISGQEDSWFVKVNEALCLASLRPVQNPMLRAMKAAALDQHPNVQSELSSIPRFFIVRNFSFINGRVKIVKASINNIAVDVSANQAPALYSVLLLDLADSFFEKDHIFKRSLLLIKTWAKHESPALSSGWGAVLNTTSGGLSTAALNILVLSIFNRFSQQIHHPLQALCLLLLELSTFEFESSVMTMYGSLPTAVALEGDNPTCLAAARLNHPQHAVPLDAVADLASRVSDIMTALGDREGSSSSSSTSGGTVVFNPVPRSSSQSDPSNPSASYPPFGFFRIGHVNVIDPLHMGNNLAAAMDTGGLGVLRHSSARGLAHIAEIIKELAVTSTAVHIESISPPRLPPSNDTEGSLGVGDNEVSMEVVQQLDKEFGEGMAPLGMMNDSIQKEEMSTIIHEMSDSACRNIFPRTWEMYGEGFRPDLRSTNYGSGGGGENNSSVHTHIYPAQSSNSSSNNNKNSQNSENDDDEAQPINEHKIADDNEILNNSAYGLRVHLEARRLLATDTRNSENAARHAELVLAAKINADALSRLVVGIIEVSGPLPVGEVGKQLQEATGNIGLSAMLKEHFGGLKKFLETMSDDFIVGDDHPFNPHVSLANPDKRDDDNDDDNSSTTGSSYSSNNMTNGTRGVNPYQQQAHLFGGGGYSVSEHSFGNTSLEWNNKNNHSNSGNHPKNKNKNHQFNQQQQQGPNRSKRKSQSRSGGGGK